jgi:nucleotide-binding universal stress UspA family protein
MYQRILVPLDGSATGTRGLQEAVALATGHPCRLLLLHVLDDYPLFSQVSTAAGYQDMLKALRQQGLDVLTRARTAVEAADVHSETLLREVTGRRVADVIVDQVRQHRCDLVIMGTHGRRGMARLTLGSDAEEVVRSCPVPVMLVRETATTVQS